MGNDIKGIKNDENRSERRAFYICLVLLQCVFWAFANPAIKISVITIMPLLGMTVRFTLAGILFLILFGRQLRYQISRKNIKGTLWVGVFTAGNYIIGTLGLSMTQSQTAGFLLSLAVLFTPFLTHFFLHKKINVKLYPVIALVIAGMYMLSMNGGEFYFGIGDFLCIVSSLCFAFTLVITSLYVKDVKPGPMATVQTCITAVVSFVCALIFEDITSITGASAEGILAIIYLAVGATFAVYLLQNTALTHLSPVLVSLLFCSQPVINIFTSGILLNESLSIEGIIGGAGITAGIVFASVIKGGGN